MRFRALHSNSVIAWSAAVTLIVVMPIFAAGLRLMPRSSRNTHSFGLDADEVAGDLVETRLRLAAANLARLDDVIEHHHDVADVHALLAAHHVVGQAGGAIAGTDHAIERSHHLRSDLAGQQAQHIGTGNPVAEGLGLVGEQRIELEGRHVAALEERPGVRVGIGCIHRPDEVQRQAVGGLVPVERFEGTREDHTTEIPEHCSDHDGRAYDGSAAADLIEVTMTCGVPQPTQEREAMTSGKGPAHVVVDGSNIATEGRSLPSLAQLSEAVMSFMEEHPDTAITVVVDATFGHRIDKKEVKEFEDGISNNELVAPPAGAVGRGDAFVLAIAQKSNASILSNDSFQEFHADYEWLFDEGRLIGGKPVPHVGWVFVDRLPVRGPVSRKATGSKGGSRRGAKKEGGDSERRSGRKASDAASQPMPVPKTPPPGRSPKSEARVPDEVEATPAPQRPNVPKSGDTVNDLMPFLEFVEHHPVGTSVNGTVESYSSHGAYISIGENGVRGYVPLRLMADPAPPSARKVMKLGESVTVVVVSFAPLRRSIDCAVPDMAQAAIVAAREEQAEESSAQAPAASKRAPKKSAAKQAAPDAESDEAATTVPAKKAPAKRTAAKKPAAPSSAPKQPAARKAAAKKAASTTQQARPKAPAKKAAATKAPAKKVAATKAAAKKAPATTAPAKKAPAKKAAATKAPVKKAPAKKAPARKRTSASGANGG